MIRRLTAALLLATALTACTAPAGPQDSGIPTPSFWAKLTGAPDLDAPLESKAEAGVEQQWWTHFHDPMLNAMIDEALLRNQTLAMARARVEEARAERGLARSLLLPQVDLNASAQRANLGFYTADKPITLKEASLEADWEIDLFGRNQANLANATALLQSEEATRQGVTVGLLAEVARNYFDLRNAQCQIAITRKNLETQKKTLELIQVQLQGALASDFDVQRASAQVSTTTALIPALQTALDAASNRLNVLLGQTPGTKNALLAEPVEWAPLDSKIVVSAPATVLATRPDVRAAERRFAASISASDAATRALFPTISLTALFGVQDASLGSSSPWTLGAGLVQPILNFGRLSSQIDAADARQQGAFADYQRTVLEALENMENALSGYLNETARNQSLRDAVTQNRKAQELAKLQFTSGYNGLLDVLIVERNTLDAESSLAASDTDLRKNLVNLYTAAGGGWEVAEAAAPTAPAEPVP